MHWSGHFYKTCLFWGKLLLLIHLHYTFISYLSHPQPNMSLIGEGCDSLKKTSLMSHVGNHWPTGGLQVNSSSVKGGLISFPLFLHEEDAILPMITVGGDLVFLTPNCDIFLERSYQGISHSA